MSSRLMRHTVTKDANTKELVYRNEIQPTEVDYSQIDSWIGSLDDGRRDILSPLMQLAPLSGRILELGAGSCWLTAELSKFPQVEEIFALDMSEHILTVVAPVVFERVGAVTDKITRVIGDFNKLEFSDHSLDHVVFDAAVHHIPVESFATVCAEIGRVLKPGGSLVAVREPVLPTLPLLREYKRKKFGEHERQFGVTENSFTRSEWTRLFADQGGFELELRRIASSSARRDGLRGVVKTVLEIPGMAPLRELLWPGDFVFVAQPTVR